MKRGRPLLLACAALWGGTAGAQARSLSTASAYPLSQATSNFSQILWDAVIAQGWDYQAPPVRATDRGLIGSLTNFRDTGSGVVADPSKAGVAQMTLAMKQGYGTAAARAGELDGQFVIVRQDKGDAAGLLVDVGTIAHPSGAGGILAIESHSRLIDRNVVRSDVNFQAGAVTADGRSAYGVVAIRYKGDGGTGLFVNSLPGASFGYGMELLRQNRPMLRQRTSDGALLLYDAATGQHALGLRNDGAALRVSIDGADKLILAANGSVTAAGPLTIGGTLTLAEVPAARVAAPSAGRQTLFLDTADHKLKRKDSAGRVTSIE